MSNDNFMVELMKIVDKYAPIKQKYIRLNQRPFITKKIRKEIMKRSRLRNIYLRDSSPVAKQAYNKQRNLCCSLIKKPKKDYYSKLDPSLITSARKFWKTTKSLFLEKIFSEENINLIESESESENIVSRSNL